MESKKALIRLFAILAGTLITLFIVVVTLRTMALRRPPIKTEILGLKQTPSVFAGGDLDQGSPFSARALEATLNLGDAVVPTLEVRASADGEWILYNSDSLSEWTNGDGEIERQNWAELKKLRWKNNPDSGGLLLLRDFIAQHPLPKVLILVHHRAVAAAASLLKILGDRDEPALTMMRAENHQLNRELRKQRPLWYFVADSVTLTQWQLFTALWLDPLAPTSFEWVPNDWPRTPMPTSPRLYAELKRRGIGSILWSNDSQSLQEKMQQTSPLGILTNRPKLILEYLKVAQSQRSN